VLRALDPSLAAKTGASAQSYVNNGMRFKKGLKKIG
jgi:hypothetical protein